MSDLNWTKSDGLAWADDEDELVRYRVVRDKRHWYVEVVRIEEVTYSDSDSVYVLRDPAGHYLMADHVRSRSEGTRWSEGYQAAREQFNGEHRWLRCGSAWEYVWATEEAEETAETAS